ncbi:MAG: pyridoxal-dependent decarboxylase, exosortase A system-associated [Ferrovum sp.]|nr:pyridoxal-dependent decarboxylase, exosortase A system-associated [Ferrovum sp.]
MSKPVHHPACFAMGSGNALSIGGIDLPRLAHQVGQTPFFAYDRTRIFNRVQHLRSVLPEGIHLHYAIKANPMPAVVQFLATQVDGLDVASGGELGVALDTRTPRAHISFAGPGKSAHDLLMAMAADVVLNLESEGELATVLTLRERHGYRPKVAIRVNPDFELRGSGMRMGGGAKPFGVDVERVPAMVRRILASDLSFQGFHIFSGSQSLKADALIEAQKNTVDLAIRLVQDSGCPLPTLNLGGGFGIPYFPGEAPLELERVGEALQHLLPHLRRQLPDTQPVIELGRYLVGEAGVYVCRILDRKVSRGQTFLITDGGLHHHLAASGNFGQVIRKNYPVSIVTRKHSPALEEVSVVGPLCTPLDLLADKMTLPQAEVGDLVVIHQSGAYGPSASPAAFLGHPPAREALIGDVWP